MSMRPEPQASMGTKRAVMANGRASVSQRNAMHANIPKPSRTRAGSSSFIAGAAGSSDSPSEMPASRRIAPNNNHPPALGPWLFVLSSIMCRVFWLNSENSAIKSNGFRHSPEQHEPQAWKQSTHQPFSSTIAAASPPHPSQGGRGMAGVESFMHSNVITIVKTAMSWMWNQEEKKNGRGLPGRFKIQIRRVGFFSR